MVIRSASAQNEKIQIILFALYLFLFLFLFVSVFFFGRGLIVNFKLSVCGFGDAETISRLCSRGARVPQATNIYL